MLLYLALITLPVDGTAVGIQLPYWSPIAPWFFLAYSVWNWRYLRLTLRRFLPFFLFPIMLALTSIYGWQTIAVHGMALTKSFVSILLGLACLTSLDIAFIRKRLSWRTALSVLIAAYWVAFATGVLQYLAQGGHLNWKPVRAYFVNLLHRPYIWTRPQFLFAEPSYIGMHLFGVLLPCYWITRDRRLAVLIPTFAIGSIAMGAGTRIIIDSAVALFLWMVTSVNFRDRRATWGFVGGMAAIGIGSIGAMLFNPRLNSLLTHGLLAGDGSMSARIFHALAPMWSWLHDPAHFLLGWGAGNISDAVRNGYLGARRWYDAHGGIVGWEIRSLADPPADTFTMSLYSSFISEFGILMFAVFLLMSVIHVTRHHAWNRTVVVWMVLIAYLYIQFESYAFYAIPLFIWTVGNQHGCGLFEKDA
ncbi:hypothetical protein Uis1B_1489 [Bifidobacterium margollesii]|uniref:O-antigen polymerase n=1 Tax=Bifidobacterium margollesii TaxID=2020964 RepID=A0A2N5J8X0_9BIFI|nr:hypothetical protein [Bifidobacterium margollesii]PLS30662.1 hypothetical protein Uis1B_1489 [Bifidobacterium margollesii]